MARSATHRLWCRGRRGTVRRAAGALAAAAPLAGIPFAVSAASSGDGARSRQSIDVAWQTIDGLKIRHAAGGSHGETVVLFSPWPESILAFEPMWVRLASRLRLLAIDLPGFGRSEGRDDLFSPRRMGEFILVAFDAFGVASVHVVGLDIGSPSLLFAALTRTEMFRSIMVGAGASTYPLVVEDNLKAMLEAPTLPPLNSIEVLGRFLESIHGYAVPGWVRDDYLVSYARDRLTRSAAFVRAYPTDLAARGPRPASLKRPVPILVGRNGAYELARDAAILRERLPRARLDVLEAGPCVGEERAPEFKTILSRWFDGGYQDWIGARS